ncbi:MAG: alpha/beta hydrolase-fold protein [Armatimonadota bacterium]
MKVISYIMLANALLASITIPANADVITATHKSGQTFVIWSEKSDSNIHYNLYRSDKAITTENLKSAKLIASQIPSGSGVDLLAKQHLNLPYIKPIKDTMGPDWYQIVDVAQPADPAPKGLVVSTFGKPLPIGTGLYVYNISAPGISYYAITTVDKSGNEDRTITPGVNATASSVKEIPATPKPIMERLKKTESGETFKYYTHWSTKDIALKENISFKFEVQVGEDVGKGEPSSLILLLHGAGGAETLPVPTVKNVVMIVPNNYTPGFPFVYDWWYGYNTNSYGGDVTKGVNINFTEKRLLYILDWAKSEFNIDENHVYLTGTSMGGTGTLLFGLRHPEIFAAIFANVPHTNTGDGVSDHESWFAAMWGKRSDAVKTDEGINIWDRLNMTAYVSNPANEIPYVKTVSARADVAMPWRQIPAFIRAMNDARRGFISGWGPGVHNLPFEDRPEAERRFDIYKLAKNVSYPAFSNSSINDDPGNGDAADGAPMGQVDGGFDWQILADEKNMWSVEIKPYEYIKGAVVVDVTPRRLQRLQVKKDVKYYYTNKDISGNLLQSGYIEADGMNLITLKSMEISLAGNAITITRK